MKKELVLKRRGGLKKGVPLDMKVTVENVIKSSNVIIKWFIFCSAVPLNLHTVASAMRDVPAGQGYNPDLLKRN